jgi:prephenate dehydrogenase
VKIDRICIIGVGLIGGSLALALKKAGYCKHIVGAGRDSEKLQQAVALGIIDSYETDFKAAVANADLVFLSVPMGAMYAVLLEIMPVLQPHTIITDAGSSKVSVVNDATKALAAKLNQFVPGHPIAGIEKSGADAAFDSLYQGRRIILTPLKENSRDAIDTVVAMWQATGAEVDKMSAEHHDLVLAGTSHLPHVLAFALVDCLNQVEEVDEIFRFAAGGFRDFTRIASSDPVMWRDICLANRDAILLMMQRYQAELEQLRSAITGSDEQALFDIFSRAKQARDDFFM